jgi:hypothetical protein
MVSGKREALHKKNGDPGKKNRQTAKTKPQSARRTRKARKENRRVNRKARERLAKDAKKNDDINNCMKRFGGGLHYLDKWTRLPNGDSATIQDSILRTDG